MHLFRATVTPLALLAMGIFSVHFLLQWAHLEAPYANLRSFAFSESAGRGVHDVQELPVDSLSLYAQATCVRAASADGARHALRAQLRRVPADAVDDIVAGAVVDGASTTNSVQNTTAGVGADGVAHHYVAFWSTAFGDGAAAVAAPRYVSCVTTAGVRVIVGEDIAEWRTTRTRRYLGTRPCHCGVLWCERCPLFVTDETRAPVFRRHRLTLRQQVQLHNWMVLQAVERAKSLTTARESIFGAFMRSMREYKVANAVFRALEADTFLGRDEKGGEEHLKQHLVSLKEEL